MKKDIVVFGVMVILAVCSLLWILSEREKNSAECERICREEYGTERWSYSLTRCTCRGFGTKVTGPFNRNITIDGRISEVLAWEENSSTGCS